MTEEPTLDVKNGFPPATSREELEKQMGATLEVLSGVVRQVLRETFKQAPYNLEFSLLVFTPLPPNQQYIQDYVGLVCAESSSAPPELTYSVLKQIIAQREGRTASPADVGATEH